MTTPVECKHPRFTWSGCENCGLSQGQVIEALQSLLAARDAELKEAKPLLDTALAFYRYLNGTPDPYDALQLAAEAYARAKYAKEAQ